jgi:transcriptional regulator with XRE-family HTH domain
VLARSNIWAKLQERLQRRAYRHAYLGEHVRRGIAYQIRALRDQRQWKQGEFSKRLNKPQSVVCRLEDPSYGKVTVQTLLEIANVFDVALEVRFVPYSSFIIRTRDVSSSAMHVLSFDDDIGMKVEVINTDGSSCLSTSDIGRF